MSTKNTLLPTTTPFGDWLRQTRLQYDEDMRTFAQRISINAGTVSLLERNRNQVTLHTVIRICKGLHLSLSDFSQQIGYKIITPVIASIETNNTIPTLTQIDTNRFIQILSTQPNTALTILFPLVQLISTQHPLETLQGLAHIIAFVLAPPICFRVIPQYPPRHPHYPTNSPARTRRQPQSSRCRSLHQIPTPYRLLHPCQSRRSHQTFTLRTQQTRTRPH